MEAPLKATPGCGFMFADCGCLLSGGWAAALVHGADRMSDVPTDLGQWAYLSYSLNS